MPLKVGDRAPAFTLYDTEKKQRTLKEFLGKKTVLAFYPGAFTGVCTKEMCTFRDVMSAMSSINAQIVGISVDSPFANRVFAERNNFTFPLLSDFNREVAMQYTGLQKDFSGLSGYNTAKRSVFVLDPEGTVRYAWISENPGVEPNYDEVKSALASF
jgi:glutaredoxin-dependent peroxiredoxin